MTNLGGYLRISSAQAGALLIAGTAAIAVISPFAAMTVARQLVVQGFAATRIW